VPKVPGGNHAMTHSRGSVLLLACYFPPENTSGAARSFRFYKYLQKIGYCVQVLTASKQDENDALGNVACVSDSVQKLGRRILRFFVRMLLGRVVALESLTWAFRAFDAAEQAVSQEKFCAIYSTSSPVISHLVAGRLKKLYGIRWIADFRDPLVGNPFRTKRGISYHLDRITQAWIFNRADALIANTDATLELWKKEYPEYQGKMHLIWNGFDPEEVRQPSLIPRRGYKLLIHAGTIYGIRDPGPLLSSVYRLIKRDLLSPERFRLQLIGPLMEGWSHDTKQAEDLVRLGVLQCDGRLVPNPEAVQALASADGLVLLDCHAAGGAVQVPAKLFDYVRIGRPILAVTTRNSPVDRLLARSGVPYVSIYPEDAAEEVDQKVLFLLGLTSEPVVASDWFWKEFDALRQTQALASLIASLQTGSTTTVCQAIGQG